MRVKEKNHNLYRTVGQPAIMATRTLLSMKIFIGMSFTVSFFAQSKDGQDRAAFIIVI
jgi:hypothetical protein